MYTYVLIYISRLILYYIIKQKYVKKLHKDKKGWKYYIFLIAFPK